MISNWVVLGAVLGALALMALYVSWSRTPPTVESYNVAMRKVGYLRGSAGVSANWVHVPVALLSAKFLGASYFQLLCFAGFGFTSMLMMAWLSPHIQKAMEYRGYTLPEVMGRIGPSVRTLHLIPVVASLMFVVSQSLTAIQQSVTQELGISGWIVSVASIIVVAIMVLPRGLPGALIGDATKVTVIIAIALGGLFIQGELWMSPIAQASTHGNIGSISDFWVPGVALAVSSLAGPLCNADIGERTNAIKKDAVRKCYITAAFFYAVSIAAFAPFGPLAMRLGIPVGPREFPLIAVVHYAVENDWVGKYAMVALMVLLIVKLTMAVGSMVMSAGNVLSIEIVKRVKPSASDEQLIWWARLFICLVLSMAVWVAYKSPPLTILVQTVGGARGVVLVPFFLALFAPRFIPEKFVFWGMLAGCIGGIGSCSADFIWSSITGEGIPFFAKNGFSLGAACSFLCPALACIIAVFSGNTETARISAQSA